MTARLRAGVLVAIAAGAILLCLALPRIAQTPSYHAFADDRPALGVPNFWNVVSNAGFLLAGAWGLLTLARSSASRPWALLAFFTGVTLTTFGSAYYHLAPSNDTLLWDRLPMTTAFMGFFAALVSERVAPAFSRYALVPLLAFGAASVLYWYFTERAGAGDLRPYILVQGLPVILTPIVLLLFPGERRGTRYLVLAVAAYGAAKLFETFDDHVYESLNELFSGHSIKHLLAAASAAFVAAWNTARASSA